MQKHVNFSTKGLLVFALVLGLTSAMHLNAQATSKATYDKTTKMLALDTKAPFSYLFELDIKPMNFASKEKADAFFSNWTTELVSFQVNYEKRTAEVLLKTRMNPTWGVKEWNDYLAQLPKQ